MWYHSYLVWLLFGNLSPHVYFSCVLHVYKYIVQPPKQKGFYFYILAGKSHAVYAMMDSFDHMQPRASIMTSTIYLLYNRRYNPWWEIIKCHCSVCRSATWPPEVRRLAESYLKNPFQVYVGSLDLQVCAALSVYHVGSSPSLILKIPNNVF